MTNQLEIIVKRAKSLEQTISRIPWSEVGNGDFPKIEKLFKDLGEFLKGVHIQSSIKAMKEKI